jgi:hypothetical protein
VASRFKPLSLLGIDFSGAKQPAHGIWIAELQVPVRGLPKLHALSSLYQLSGLIERGPALDWLVQMVRCRSNVLIGIDFPFGLPIELFPPGTSWRDQLRLVCDFDDDAKAFGHECLRRARLVGDKLHIRRATDLETRTPFDCYHYRIIYQTFHGMRDVLARLAGTSGTAIVPFDRVRRSTRRVIVEACPGSTLKRLGLPHQNYKQPAGGALTRKRRSHRNQIVNGITRLVQISPQQRRVLMRNPGGDALDAVIASVGVLRAYRELNGGDMIWNDRYPLEGLVFA